MSNAEPDITLGFDEEHAPASLALILDSSGSMEGASDERLLHEFSHDREALWEKGLYSADFDEPGDIEVDDNGTAYITQDFNLFIVDKNGNTIDERLYEATGKRYHGIVFDRAEELLFENIREDGDWATSVAMSNNGSFVCGMTNRIYYVRLEPPG